MWIARDNDGRLFLYFSKKPQKRLTYWAAMGDFTEIIDEFPSVKWEDEKPTKVEYDDKLELVICK